MKYRELSSWNKIELRVYRLLGVNQFRKAILWFEKTKHYKDKGKNENYHPSNLDVLSLERYNGFLLYNTLLHSVSLLFFMAFLILSMAFDVRNVVVDMIMIILSLLNLYCIFLQRTNYLKIKEYCNKYHKRVFNRRILCNEEIIQRIYTREPQKLQADYEVICKIIDAYLGKKDCTLNVSDIESMKRICECIEPVLLKKPNRPKKEVAEVGLIDSCNLIPGPYTALQMRADWLQRKLGLSGRKMLDHTVIITEDAECEILYRKLVPEDTVYNMCFVCCLLHKVFTGAIVRVKANET